MPLELGQKWTVLESILVVYRVVVSATLGPAIALCDKQQGAFRPRDRPFPSHVDNYSRLNQLAVKPTGACTEINLY